MSQGWMIRAGEGGRLFDDFETRQCVAVGWNDLGDLREYDSHEALRQAFIEHFGNAKAGAVANAVAMIRKFRDDIQAGDYMITYSPELRQYLVGIDQGEYAFMSPQQQVGDYANIRRVEWQGKVSRDDLAQATRSSLGSTLAVFRLSAEVLADMRSVLEGKPTFFTQAPEEVEADFIELGEDVRSRSHELIKDKIQQLTPDEMEHFVAAVLRAMGYRTKVSPRGPDRGVDVMASPDGLGVTRPRIKVEVKHRNGSMGAQDIRSFIGTLRDGDNGVYLSTGGFTKEARYEAERATLPVTLVDIDDLADLTVDNYDRFDLEGRSLLPLMRLYWPAE